MSLKPHEPATSKNLAALRSAVVWHQLEATSAARVRASRFTGRSGVTEWHIAVSLADDPKDAPAALEAAWLSALEYLGLEPASTLFRRVFWSERSGLGAGLARFAEAHPGAFSSISQGPLAGDSFAIWSHHLTDPRGKLRTAEHSASFSCLRGELRHHWFCDLHDTESPKAGDQTRRILEKHDGELQAHGLTLAEHVVRTWWFLRDIDDDYQALVDVRREFFEKHGLTERTHFIASTGIAGGHRDPSVKVTLDSYAIGGLIPEQIEYLNAPEHLGPTHHYGVTFERGTAISYADRRHLLISGTASIDPAGNILYPGDVLRQLERSLDNVGALLAGAGATFADLMVVLVYLREPAHGPAVKEVLDRRFPHLTMAILHAPVCRPGWLVEVEGIAVVHAWNPALPEF